MSNPGGTGSNSRYGDTREKELQDWMNKFKEQLDSQQVDREAVLQAEADVRAHCSDSGQAPSEAFGDPRSYATTLSAEVPHASVRIPIVKRIELILMCIGFAIALTSITSNGPEVSISLGALLTIVIVIPLFWLVVPSTLALSLPRNPESPSRRSLDESHWRALLAVLVLFAVCAAFWWSLNQNVFTVNKWIPVVLSIILIMSGVTLSGVHRYYRRARQSP